MFESRIRDVVFPQSEHQNISGLMARHWGNANFEFPEGIEPESFILAVATHDRAFGYLDEAAIGRIDATMRAEQVDRWITQPHPDPATEISVLMHVRRLMGYDNNDVHFNRLDEQIKKIASAHDLALAPFEQADSIMSFCDGVAFDFCFEEAVERTVPIYARRNIFIDVTFKIDNRIITVDPWPFSVPQIKGYILAYTKEGYPDAPVPELVSFEFAQHAES